MPAVPLLLASILYLWTAIACCKQCHYGLAVVWTCYAIANFGYIWELRR